MSVTRFPVSTTFDALGDDYYRDPAREFEKVRGDAPVFWYPYLNAWVVTGKEDCEYVLSDWQKFSSAGKGQTIEVPEEFQHIVSRELISTLLVGSDPPGHTAHRAVAGRGFVKPRMDALAPVIEARAHRILDKIGHLGAANIVEAYCLELTTQTFCSLIDVPDEDEEWLRVLRDDMFHVLSSALEPLKEPLRTEVWDRYTTAQLRLRAYVEERIQNPGDDLISLMTSITDRDGNMVLSVEEIALHIAEFAGAATDTTAQAMANAIIFLSQNEGALAEAIADPELWPRVFDETVRRRPSGTATRWVREDVTLSGVDIKAGDVVWLALASANTDESYYENPFDFDIHREQVGDHLAFTKGRHTCLGQPLARVQGSVGLKVLFERLPSLRPEADFPIDFLRMALLPIRRSLPVTWDPADATR
jgi:Cytochrome P450